MVPGSQPALTIRCESTTGHQEVHVGVIAQVTGPGLEEAHHANLPPDKAGVQRQLLQRRR